MNNSNHMRLLLRPRPFEGESLPGYLLRVAEANGFSYSLFNRFLIPTTRYSKPFPAQVSQYADLLDLKPEELLGLAYLPGEGKDKYRYVIYFGQKLHLRRLKVNRPAVCPVCLQERPAIHGFWDFQYAVACPFHGVRMIDSCQQCGKSLSIFRTKICECKDCGFDYRLSATDPAFPNALELIRLIYSISNISLLPERTDISILGMPIKILKSESMNTLSLTIDVIAKDFMHESVLPKDERDSHKYSTTLDHAYQKASLASYFLSDWPDRFLDAIYGCIQKRYTRRNTGSVSCHAVIKDLQRENLPRLIKEIGSALFQCSTFIHGKRFLNNDALTKIKPAIKAISCY